MKMKIFKGGLFKGKEIVALFLNGVWIWILSAACFSKGWDNNKAWDNDEGRNND